MAKLILIGLIALGLLSAAGCNAENVLGMERATETREETIALDSADSIVLDVRNGVGEITLIGAETDAIQVKYQLTAYGETQADADRELAEMSVIFTQEANRVQIRAVQPPRPPRGQSNKVDLTITVPRTIDLVVQNDVGGINARQLRTPQQLQIATNVGNITLREIDAGPLVEIAGDVGDITFEGSLSDEGSTSIRTDVGKLRVRLAEDTGAELEARTGVGSIALRGLSASQQSLKKSIPGESLTAILGAGGPTLTLTADVGDITLEEL